MQPTITHKIGVQFLAELVILTCPFTTKQTNLQKEIGSSEQRISPIKLMSTVMNLKSTKCLQDLQPKISKSKIGKSFKLMLDILWNHINYFYEVLLNSVSKTEVIF